MSHTDQTPTEEEAIFNTLKRLMGACIVGMGVNDADEIMLRTDRGDSFVICLDEDGKPGIALVTEDDSVGGAA